MYPEIPAEQVQAAVERVAMEILELGDVQAPPVDAAALARSLGITVMFDATLGTRGRLTQVDGHGGLPTIVVADDPRPERRHWSIAHELGEIYAHRVLETLGLPPDDSAQHARERIANLLANCLLVPRAWFEKHGSRLDWDLFELKAHYATASNELIARRMLDMSPGVIITMCDQGRTVWRKNNRSLQTPPLTPPETAAWRTAYEYNEPARCDDERLPQGVEDCRAWPVHEDGWKREFVRTALAEY